MPEGIIARTPGGGDVSSWRGALLVALFSMAISLAALAAWGVPAPYVHDEFSYLLNADTFAHGRLTNPTHPLWPHFESIHIIHVPSYNSKYPPAQGLVLALGQVVFGEPFLGVCLSVALMSAAVCWMLRGLMPGRWAILGGVLTAIIYGLSPWGRGYWGGALATTGGALLFGATIRLTERLHWRNGALLALGLALLANTRPYEGMVAGLLAGATILGSWRREPRPTLGNIAGHLALPAGLILTATAAAMAYYNWRNTGNPRLMPYQVHEATYASTPVFWFQAPPPLPAYRHAAIRDFFQHILNDYRYSHESLRGFLDVLVHKFGKVARFYFRLPPVFLLALPWLWRDRWMRWALLVGAAALLASAPGTWLSPHYVAPVGCLYVAVNLAALRMLDRWRWGAWPLGRVMMIVCVALSLASVGWIMRVRDGYSGLPWAQQRRLWIEEAQQRRERWLVLVRYRQGHSVNDEWVYNQADIDAAAVVWAREIDPQSDRRLLDYFHDRKVWVLEVGDFDHQPPRLVPYAGATQAADDSPSTAPRFESRP